jgi:hypothetical protein
MHVGSKSIIKSAKNIGTEGESKVVHLKFYKSTKKVDLNDNDSDDLSID